ncbi:MAG: peptidase [Firmicutes bacterium]|nr:peptidase [Bacillota bacterium]
MNTRLTSLREFLTSRQLDGILINKPENCRYFSGFTGSSGILLITKQAARLITDFRYIEQASKEATGFDIIRHGSNLYETVRAEISDQSLNRVGFESSFVTYTEYQQLVNLAVDFVPVILDELRMIKDASELVFIRQAVNLADMAFTHILSFIKPGVTENAIALELEYHMRKNGAENAAFDTIVASGARSALPHGRASEKVIEVGDLVTMDFGALYKGYHSDITRTVSVGRASTKQREIYKLVLSAQLAGASAIRPGMCASDVDNVSRKIISDAGYANFFGHGLGHGVGLAVHEEPRLSPSCNTVLSSGMVITVEPGVYLPDWGGVRIEDTVVVTADGVEILTASSKEFIEL